jgi:hypothetical protein
MTETHDLVVVGGGIAGTLAVVAALSRGLEVAWVAPPLQPDDQSAHWHGHLHRGRLYDPVRERGLIQELSQNVPFWWSDAAVRFHTDVETIAVGPDRAWASEFEQRLGGIRRNSIRPDYLAQDAEVVRTDEAILDGPAFLGAATEVASRGSLHLPERCDRLRRTRDGDWEAVLAEPVGDRASVRAAAVILAAGTTASSLVPGRVRLDRTLDARLSRMLVLRGALPTAAAIMPSRSAGGLFFASRELPGHHNGGERVWLVSDGFSSGGTESRGPLTDGWWTCSVIERLAGFVDPVLLAGTRVAGYRAAKSRLRSSPAQVPAEGFAIDREAGFVALTPSKWSTAPTSAAHALAALIADPVPVSARTAAMADLLLTAHPPLSAPFAERWESTGVGVPLHTLRNPGSAALHLAGELFRHLDDRSATGFPLEHVA